MPGCNGSFLCRQPSWNVLARTAVVGAFAWILLAGHGRGEDLASTLAGVRGANYIPSYASTSIAAWKDYQPEVVERELGYAERLGLNSVRVYLSTVVFEAEPERFRASLADFVARSDRHNIRPMFVLFDSCFGEEPSLAKADSPTWVNNPGFSRVGPEHWPPLEHYVREVVEPFRGDRRILAWDVMNEPMADFNHVTSAERDAIWRFVGHFCSFVKQQDRDHPITVGHAVVEYIPRTLDQVDFASVHSYAPHADWFRADLDLARSHAKAAGKPVLITECGNPGAGQSYPMVFRVAKEAGAGFYFWELMIGKMMFRDSAGLIYPDGATRDPEAVAALLGFPRQSDGVPIKPPPDWKPIRDLLDDPSTWPELLTKAEQAPRTREGIAPIVLPLATVGRVKARPGKEAAEIFELGLSIGQLFRLGRDAEALTLYAELLKRVRRVIGPADTSPE